MADVANAVAVSKDLSDLVDNSVPSECSDTNTTKPATQPLGYQEIESFSDLSFRTGDDISLTDLIESEFAARISSLSAEASPREESKDGFDELDEIQELLDFEQNQAAKKNDDFDIHISLDDFLSGPVEEAVSSPTEGGIGPSPDVVSDNGTPTTEPDLVAFKTTRPSEMPIVSSFDPFARIEEDSDCSNSNPMSAPNVLNSPDEFPFPDSPQECHAPCDEPMVDLFVKTISDENLDLSDPAQNEFSRFNTSSVESVNNSCPNVSDLTSPDRADHDEFFSDDLISSEPVETVIDQDDGTSSVSHQVDLSTEETETGLEDQSLHQVEPTGDEWITDKAVRHPPEGEPPERGPVGSAEDDLQILISGTITQPPPTVEIDLVDSPPLSEDASPLLGEEKFFKQEEVNVESSPISEVAESPEKEELFFQQEELTSASPPLSEGVVSSPKEDTFHQVEANDESPSVSEGLTSPTEEKVFQQRDLSGESPPISEKLKEDPFNQDLNPEFARVMAPIATEEDTEEWTTVEAALEGAGPAEEEAEIEQDLVDVEGVDSVVTNPAVVTNAPDILIVPAEAAESDQDSSEVSAAFFFRLPTAKVAGPIPLFTVFNVRYCLLFLF